jgi:FdrA protein
MVQRYRVLAGRYIDSVLLMRAGREVERLPRVKEATAVVATAANRELLGSEGFHDLPEAGEDAILFAVEAEDPASADAALEEAVRTIDRSAGGAPASGVLEDLPALVRKDAFPVVFVSTPGTYAAEIAHAALAAGANVHIFSSNVPIEEEIALKEEADRRGLFVMGPDCGTAILDGIGLGFANHLRRGNDVGVVGSSGTGIQELTTQMDRAGLGVSYALGTGSRDLTTRVGGRSTRRALDFLMALCPAVVVVSKRADPQLVDEFTRRLQGLPSAWVALGSTGSERRGQTLLCGTVDEAVAHLLALRGTRPRDEPPAPALPSLAPGRQLLRGYFVGGSLCYQAQGILRQSGIEVRSNAPLDPTTAAAPGPDTNVCIDTGAEEFVKGRPHPMIDPLARNSLLVRESARPDVRVLLFDIVLGYGSAPDPLVGLEELARGPIAVSSICGTETDVPGYGEIQHRLERLGVTTFPSAFAAARFAARAMGGSR